MKNKRMKRLMIIIMMLGLFILGIGGKTYMDSKKNMIEIVRKNESLIENELKKYDRFKKIQSISINYESIQKSPMGGILFQGFVNNDQNLIFNAGLQKNNSLIEVVNTSPKKKLHDYLEKDD
ncbi:hypothetical protein UAY_00897 [Enterococcus moraviensis ATCC BAA-383]|uniref:DUF1433 domain-containing protein n=1 Tax=Enterococcus moraviensis ATCC BAA-383 TaxID=1158609 RepID=R2TS26_9ENTE|nr:DUF1310 family protein [Enterococcus moraviensis]EOI02972.1 hypothetical protein UAY_00897 [Enterococcus moraviensis ATCC BAA-383]EOT73973.1 hypothetical protein I586_00969 [Enterococcus moraviensis ATCC BAA-383]